MAKSILKKNKNQVNILRKTPEDWGVPPKGKPTGICKTCGAEFEQDYVSEKNRYTNYKRCHSCRKKAMQENKPIEIAKLNYTPFPAQQLFHESKARFRILCCGNRFGKDFCTTMEGIRIFADLLSENRWIHKPDMTPSVYWWIIAPTEKQAKQNWGDLNKHFPHDWIVDRSNATYTMQTIGDGIIEVRSGYDPESLVGVGLDLVTITEAARIKDLKIAWSNLRARLDSPGRGLASDKPPNAKYGFGKAIINSSPIGKNDFYDLWLQGQKNSDSYMSLFESWQFEAWENPATAEMRNMPIQTKHGTITYEQSLIEDMGLRQYQQNYLAMFLDNSTSCFPNFEENCVEYMPLNWSTEQKQAYIDEWQKPIPDFSYVIGYDPAKGAGDSPTVWVREINTGKVKRILDLFGKEWKEQWAIIRDLSIRYNHAPVSFGRTGHETIETNLQEYNLTTIPHNEQGSGKHDLVINLETVVEGKRMRILHDGTNDVITAIRQFRDYSAITRGTSVSYSNVKQPHDDHVSAAYFAFFDSVEKDETTPYVGVMIGV